MVRKTACVLLLASLLTGTAAARLVVSTNQLTNAAPQGDYILTQFIEISAQNETGDVPFKINCNFPWLRITPTSGTCSDEYAEWITIEYLSDQPAGTYQGIIYVEQPGSTNLPAKVWVQMVLTPVAELAAAAPGSITQRMVQGSTDTLDFPIEVWNTGSATGRMPYSIAFNAWDDIQMYCLPPTSGISHSVAEINLHTIRMTNLLSLTNGEYYSGIYINQTNWNNAYIDVTLQVTEPPAAVQLSTNALSGSGEQGRVVTNLSVDISNSGGGTLEYRLATSEPWLSILDNGMRRAGTTNTVKLAADTADLAPGTHTAYLLIYNESTNAVKTSEPDMVAVQVNVQPYAAVIAFQPSFKDIGRMAGSGNATFYFTVSNAGTGTLNYALSADAFFTVSPSNGLCSATQTNQHTVTIHINDIAEGAYTNAITIASAHAGNSPQTLDVYTMVLASLFPSPMRITESIPEGHSVEPKTITVFNNGSTNDIPFTASSDAEWVRVSPTNATATPDGTNLTVTLITTNLTEGHYSAVLRIEPDDGISPFRTVNISLDVSELSGGFESRILFHSNADGTYNVMSIAPTGGTPQVEQDGLYSQMNAKTSPDGFSLAWEDTSSGAWQTLVYDGYFQTTQQLAELHDIHWLPGSSGLLGESSTRNGNAISQFNLDGNTVRLVESSSRKRLFGTDSSTNMYYSEDPGWSPGTVVRCFSPTENTFENILANDGRNECSGDCSPDARTLCYAKSIQGTRQPFRIYLLDTQSGEERQLSSNIGNTDRNPVFSPDGSEIAFVREFNTSNQLLTVDVASSNETLIYSTSNHIVVSDWGSMYRPDYNPPVPTLSTNVIRQTFLYGSTTEVETTVTLRNTGGGILRYAITNSIDTPDNRTPWLLSAPPSGSNTGETDNITLYTYVGNPVWLDEGVHTGRITVTTTDDASATATNLDVIVTVEPPLPLLSNSTTSIGSWFYENGSAITQEFRIWNAGGRTLDYTLNATQPWLSLDPASGSSTGQTNLISVVVDPSGVETGSYSGAIEIFSNGGTNTLQAFMKIRPEPPNPPVLMVDPSSLGATTTVGRTAAPIPFEVWNDGGGTIVYSVSSTNDWIEFDPPRNAMKPSRTSGEHDTTTVHFVTDDLEVGTHQGSIVIDGGTNGTNIISVTLRQDERLKFYLSVNRQALGGEVITVPEPDAQGYYADGTLVALRAKPESDYSFRNWTGDVESISELIFLKMDQRHELRAHFDLRTILMGQLFDLNGDPWRNINVNVAGMSTNTDDLGTFRFRDVPSGPQRLASQGVSPGFECIVNVIPNTFNHTNITIQREFIFSANAYQGYGTRKVYITYRMTRDWPEMPDITVSASSVGGSAFDVDVKTLEGDYGNPAGLGWGEHTIVWDAGTDWPDEYSTQMVIKVESGNQIFSRPFNLDTRGCSGSPDDQPWFIRTWADQNGNDEYDAGEAIGGAEVFFAGRTSNDLVGTTTTSGGFLTMPCRPRINQPIFARKKIYEEPAVKVGHEAVSNVMYSLWLDSDTHSDPVDWNGWWYTLYITDDMITRAGRSETIYIRLAHPVLAWNLCVAIEPNDNNFNERLKTGFSAASAYLYNVTDGQARFDLISFTSGVSRTSEAWSNADVVVYNQAEFWPCARVNGISAPVEEDGHIHIGTTWELVWPDSSDYFRTIIHEFGHYAFGFYDEYLNGEDNKAEWKEYRRNHRREIPANYGLMDSQYRMESMSSYNDYLAAYPEHVAPTTITAQVYHRDIENGNVFMPCWTWFKHCFDGTYSNVPIEFIPPRYGYYEAGRSTSSDRRHPTYIPLPYNACTIVTADGHDPRSAADTFSGTLLLTRNNQPVPGAVVTLVKMTGQHITFGRTAFDGSIYINTLTPGDTLRIASNGQQQQVRVPRDYQGGPLPVELQTVSLRASETVPALLLQGTLTTSEDFHFALQCATNISQVPQLILHPNNDQSITVEVYAASASTFTGTMHLAGIETATLDMHAETDAGTTFDTTDYLTLGNLTTNGFNRLTSGDGWSEVYFPDNSLTVNVPGLIYQGNGPVPFADEAAQTNQVGCSIFFAVAENAFTACTLNHNWPESDYPDVDRSSTKLYAWDDHLYWYQASGTVIPQDRIASISLTTNGSFVLLAQSTSDDTPPAPIDDLLASTSTNHWSVDLTWTAPGDDGTNGIVYDYSIRYATNEITATNWAAAYNLGLDIDPLPAGETETVTVQMAAPDTLYYFGIKALDEAGNASILTNPCAARSQVTDTNHNGISDQWEASVNSGRATPMGLDEDVDGDGLTTREEYLANTDPTAGDTDGDSMSDGWEIDHGLNPNSASDALLDYDGDTLINSDEYRLGTNPESADTDLDGMTDDWEHQTGLDPISITGNNGANVDPDTDDFNNYDEFVADTLPLDSNSFFYIEQVLQATPPFDVILECYTSARRSYTPQWADGLCSETNWLSQPSFTGSNAATTVIFTNTPQPAQFYRIQVDLKE